jgi:hypothetical protein
MGEADLTGDADLTGLAGLAGAGERERQFCHEPWSCHGERFHGCILGWGVVGSERDVL